MSENTLNDPQPTIWMIMRPMEGFEEIYQGKSVDYPLPLFPYTLDGALPLESERQRLGYENHLAAYLQVPRFATAVLLFPRVQGLVAEGAPVQVVDYTYQLRWRQRPLDDTILSKGVRRHSLPNYVSAFSPTRRLVIPCCQGKVIKPAYPTDSRISSGMFRADTTRVIDQQGVYKDNVYVEWEDTVPRFADNAYGCTGYPAEYVRCDGEELGLVVYRSPDLGATWDFSAPLAADWPLTSTYGTAYGSQPINPAAGVLVSVVARATEP